MLDQIGVGIHRHRKHEHVGIFAPRDRGYRHGPIVEVPSNPWAAARWGRSRCRGGSRRGGGNRRIVYRDRHIIACGQHAVAGCQSQHIGSGRGEAGGCGAHSDVAKGDCAGTTELGPCCCQRAAARQPIISSGAAEVGQGRESDGLIGTGVYNGRLICSRRIHSVESHSRLAQESRTNKEKTDDAEGARETGNGNSAGEVRWQCDQFVQKSR